METLGLFQLENLALTPSRFTLFDLRGTADGGREVQTLGPTLAALFSRAVRVEPPEVERYLQSQGVELDSPVVLLCADGVLSTGVAERLESLGYANVYVVAGGMGGLLSEL
jgi:rhodanese-related sulfurtransferase